MTTQSSVVAVAIRSKTRRSTLHRTLDVVQPGLLGTGRSDLLVSAQLLGRCGDGDPVGFVDGRRRVEFGERAATERGHLGQSVGGEVRHLVVVPGYAEIGRGQRVEGQVVVEVPVHDAVDHGRGRPVGCVIARG